MIRKYGMLVFAGSLLFCLAAAHVQAGGQGSATITLFGGNQGAVPFPHAQHQTQLKDCNICHGIFPQEPDAIQKMKASGALKAKKVMNLQCIKCHRADKRAGKPHGPIACKTCHIK